MEPPPARAQGHTDASMRPSPPAVTLPTPMGRSQRREPIPGGSSAAPAARPRLRTVPLASTEVSASHLPQLPRGVTFPRDRAPVSMESKARAATGPARHPTPSARRTAPAPRHRAREMAEPWHTAPVGSSSPASLLAVQQGPARAAPLSRGGKRSPACSAQTHVMPIVHPASLGQRRSSDLSSSGQHPKTPPCTAP